MSRYTFNHTFSYYTHTIRVSGNTMDGYPDIEAVYMVSGNKEREISDLVSSDTLSGIYTALDKFVENLKNNI